jgi:CPA2 family monovalent cation:H+ antiporter-2
MHAPELILTLTGALAAALLFGYVTQRLGLSPIVGYLLAGIAVGPTTPGFTANREIAEQLAEIGVILLMFGVGLHFHLKDLLAVRRIAIPGAVGQSALATGVTALLATAFGWSWSAGIVMGLAVSVASTVVLVRVLSDNRALHTRTGHIAVGWLVVEDLFTVVVLVVLPAVMSPDRTGAGQTLLALALAVAKVAVLIALSHALGGRFTPWLLGRVAATHSRELFTLTVLVLALGVSVAATELFGVSMALGAFLAGMMVGRSDFSLRAATEALPMRDAFAVLFFVSVGLLFDPRLLVEQPGLAAAVLGVVLVGKPLAALAITWALRTPPKVGLAAAAALAQIGEFSFLLALLGTRLGVLPPVAMNTLVAVAIISISLNPLLYRLVDPAIALAARHPRLWSLLTIRLPLRTAAAVLPASDGGHADEDVHRAVIVGYGPVGRTAARLLRENGIESTIIEMNLDAAHRLRAEGRSVVYGDAAHRDTLIAAGVETAGHLVLSPDEFPGGGEVIRQARELNPDIHIVARAGYVRNMPALRRAGAGIVFSDEGEVALAFAAAILRSLGATPEQIDRERERVHEELYTLPTPPSSQAGTSTPSRPM